MAVLELCIGELITEEVEEVRVVAHTIRRIQMWAERVAWVVVVMAGWRRVAMDLLQLGMGQVEVLVTRMEGRVVRVL